jgi:hypothetical protein
MMVYVYLIKIYEIKMSKLFLDLKECAIIYDNIVLPQLSYYFKSLTIL